MRIKFSAKLFVALAVLLGAMVVLGACGGGEDASGGGEGEITVILTDYKFEPETIELVKGQTYTLVLKNEAKQNHDFVVEELEINEEITPGESVTVEVTPAEAGTFEVLCTIEGHVDLGMTGEIVVRDN